MNKEDDYLDMNLFENYFATTNRTQKYSRDSHITKGAKQNFSNFIYKLKKEWQRMQVNHYWRNIQSH